MEIVVNQGKLFSDLSENEDLYGENNSFLETSCMRHYKDDFKSNCYEMETIQLFINEYLEEGLKQRYKELSPKIVNAISGLPINSIFYEYIYTYFVKQCVEAIDHGNYHLAKERFVTALDSLEDTLNINPTKNVGNAKRYGA